MVRSIAAFSIHVLTAAGAGCALLALLAAEAHAWPELFFWLGLALIVDAVDGPLARRCDVASILPRWAGATLDLVVDFVTYVFVPAYVIARSGLLPLPLAAPAGVLIVVTGALYFADTSMKMPDNWFRGFPALWNAVAFYLVLLAPPPWLAAAAVAALVVMTFLPFPFIHPLRVKRGRGLTMTLIVAWGVLALMAISRDMSPGPWITGALCAIGVYVAGVGLVRPAFSAEPPHA